MERFWKMLLQQPPRDPTDERWIGAKRLLHLLQKAGVDVLGEQFTLQSIFPR
jgi:hypothetical protein